MKIKLFLLLLALSTLAHAVTFNRSTGAGLASANGNWSTGTSPCGSGGDNVFVAVQTTIVLDCSLGTSGTGINKLSIEAGGSLCSYDGSHPTCGNISRQGPQTIYFNSTGTNPIGSGAITNPGSDATAFGVFVSYGTFQFLGSASNTLTLTAADGASPIYVVHERGSYNGGTGIGTAGETGGAVQSIHGGIFTCKFCVFENIGNPSFPAMIEGLAYELQSTEITPTSSLDIENSKFDSPYEFTVGNGIYTTANANWTMSNNSFNGPTAQFLGVFENTSSTQGYTFTNNTETGATTTGQTVKFIFRPGALTWTGNVTVGNAAGTIQRGQLYIQFLTAGTGPWTINNNLCLNAEGTVSYTSSCWDISFARNDSASTIRGNIGWGTYQAFHFINPSGSTSGPTISNNWGAIYKEAHIGQGVFESFGFWFILKNNIAILENDNNSVLVLLTQFPSVFQIDNMTVYAAAQGLSSGVNFGDTAGRGGEVASPSWFRSSIISGTNYGLINNHADDFSNSQCDSSGLCNNLVHGTVAGRDYCGDGVNCHSHGTGSGYDDGIYYHPNVLYGDISDATDPQFMDPTRRPTGYSTHCGGAGTIADLGTQYSYRDGLGTPYNSCYDISKMLLWLQVGFMPRNQLLRHAGFGGTYVGAVPLLPTPAAIEILQ